MEIPVRIRGRVLAVAFLLLTSALAVAVPITPVNAASHEPDLALFNPNNGKWKIRYGDGSTVTFFYGNPGDTPLMGDWDCDEIDTVAMYRRSNGFVYYRNSNDFGEADGSFFFGLRGDIPIAGDWNGDGCDTFGIYRPSVGKVFLRTSLTTGVADLEYWFGVRGDRPFVGDFDGDGVDTLGLYRTSTGLAYLTNTHQTGVAENVFFYGLASDRIIAGDWDGDGLDTVGIFRPSDERFYLRNTNSTGEADVTIDFGRGWWLPAVGNFGDPPTSVTGTFTATFLAVRQGDAALYEGPCGEVGLIDANRFRDQEVLDALDTIGTRDLAWISVSHYDADHLGAVLDIATAPGVTVGAVYDRGGSRTVKDSNTYRNYYDWVTAAGIRNPVDIGDTFTLCSGAEEVTFSVVSAGTDGTAANGLAVTEENDRGLCLHVEFGEFDLATCGDINGTDDGSRTDLETAVAPVIGDVEVAKVNHHGSAFSSNSLYVTTLSPEASIVSVGANGFGHPDPTVIARWDATGDVYQTQDPADNSLIDGNITITTDGTTGFTVSTSQSGLLNNYPLDD